MYIEPRKIVKVMRVGSYNVSYRQSPLQIFVKVEFRADGTMSFTGVESPYSNGDCAGSCGQISMHFEHLNPDHNDKRYKNLVSPHIIDYANGWDSDLWLGFLHIWHEYHIHSSNCEHQRIMGITYSKNPYHVCPICGYKIGSKWLKREIPNAVIEFLCALPNTDRDPYWI